MGEELCDFSGSGSEEGLSKIDPAEMDSTFKQPYYLAQEEAVSLKKNYILHMSATNVNSEATIAVGLSSYEALVYSIDTSIQRTSTISTESDSIVNLRFAPDNPSLLYIGCGKGGVKLWDLRATNSAVRQFTDTSNPKENNLHEKTLCSFDVNSSGRFLCAGTEVVDGDAFLLFWDTRQGTLLGGYWDCHTDDVTQVTFHPNEEDKLITGSTDGLINLYDISQSDESEALLQSFNTESSVEKLRWHEGSKSTISCVTHTADVQLWHEEDSSPHSSFNRADIASALQVSTERLEDSLYVADVHSTRQQDQLLLLAGSNHSDGRCLRSCTVKAGKLMPLTNFEGNKQIVRCSWFDFKNDVLVTGGEAGILSVWKPGIEEVMAVNTSQLKVSSKFKEEKPHKRKSKPY